MSNYKSSYTGAEIDGTVTKLIDIPQEPAEEHIGKVIGVVEGEGKGANPKYGLVPMNDGGEDFVVTFSGRTTSSSNTATCDKTGNEILAAIEEGKNIRFRYHFQNEYEDRYYDLVLMYKYNRITNGLSYISGIYTEFVANQSDITQAPVLTFSVSCGWNYNLNTYCFCYYYAEHD